MDYTVGSVADLVSGKNTPNKPKVVKRKLPKPDINSNSDQNSKLSLPAENSPAKVKKTENFTEDPPFNRGNKIPFKKGNKPPFNKKNKKDGKSADHEAELVVIDHKLINDVKKQGIKNIKGSEGEEDNNSEGTDDNSQSGNEECDNDEVPHWQNPAVKKELDSRTIFVGNIALTTKKIHLLKFFGKYGKVEAVRLRCATPEKPGVSKRLAVIKKMFHPKRATMHSYIRFEKREDALKAIEVNGTKYKEHHLRVQICDDLEKPDAKKAVFVGNLPFDVEDDDLWTAFETFGTIKSVRVVRNATSGMGIGIGYVNFDSSDSVEFALQMDDLNVKNKVVRIQRCNERGSKKRKERRQERRKDRSDNSGGQENPRSKYKKSKGPSKRSTDYKNNKLKHKKPEGIAGTGDGQENSKWKKQQRPENKFKDNSSSINVKKSVFQGAISNKKKQRPKVNRGVVQKLKLSQKIAPRTMK